MMEKITQVQYIRPCDDFPITMKFGEDWQGDGMVISNHKGIDYATPIGEPVWASAAGEVIFAKKDDSGYGNLVILKHTDNVNTLYGHLSQIDVEPGDYLQQGQPIGLSGDSGNVTGPHLHWEMRDKNGTPVDPALYLKKESAEAAPAGKITVLAEALNIRLDPGLDGLDRGDLHAGDKIEPAGEPIEKDNIRWYPVRLWIAEGENGDTYISSN